MKKSAIIKIITILLIISALINYIPTISKASSLIGDVFSDGKEFLEAGTNEQVTDMVDDSKIIATSKDIYNILLTIGIVIAAVVILVLGIQFMTGSIEQKVKVKEMLIPFTVGCIIIFGSLTIWRVVISVTSSIL